MTHTELHGIYHELAFWQQFVKTDRFLSGWVKKVKTPELHQEVADFIEDAENARESAGEAGLRGRVAYCRRMRNDDPICTGL